MSLDLDAMKAALAKAQGASSESDELDARIPRDLIAFREKYTPHPISPAWRAVTRATYGYPIDDPEERAALTAVCGHDEVHPGGYREVVVIGGRRSGKSSEKCTDLVHEAILTGHEHMKFLPKGTVGHLVLISRTARQALENFRYCRALVMRHQELAAQLASEPLESAAGGSLTFKSGVMISVLPLGKSTLRGFTILGAVLDETGWWASSDESAEQDAEAIAAVAGGMLAPIGAPPRRLFILSSPGPKQGELWEADRTDFGRVGATRLVCHAPTTVWNPSVDPALLAAARERDPRRYRREYLAEFVDAINAFFDADAIERATDGRTAEPLPPQPSTIYCAAADMAFARDASVLVIGHLERPKIVFAPRSLAEAMAGPPPQDPIATSAKFVVDVIERMAPSRGAPLDAVAVVDHFARLLRAYGVTTCTADQFGIAPLRGEFARHNIALVELTATSGSKFEHYSAFREELYAGRVSLPRHEIALREFRSLEERYTGGNRPQLGAPNRAGAHDDTVSATVWCYAAVGSATRNASRVAEVGYFDRRLGTFKTGRR